MARPNTIELVQLAVTAKAKAPEPAQALLVAALLEFLTIVGPYVRAGTSAPAMIAAFDKGVTALMFAANGPAR